MSRAGRDNRCDRRRELVFGLAGLVALAGCKSDGGTSSGASSGSGAGAGGTGVAVSAVGAPQPLAPNPQNTIRVGPTQTVRTIAQAAAIARDGDVVEIDAGTYTADVAVWTQRNLTIRGVGGTPRIDAGGTSAEGKAIFVVRGDGVVVENLVLANCRVPDRNGAGIRHETGKLTVRNVIFEGNEDGILTGNDASLTLEIYDSRFVGNGAGDGFSHNLYVGRIGRFVVQGSYFTRANVGHLLKSRAQESHIFYNRITDESGGSASYEIDLPDGGVAFVVGNLIEQGAATQNFTIVSFGAESLYWPTNELYFSQNTVVNDRASGTFVRTPAGSYAKLVNNLFVGPGANSIGGTSDAVGNASVSAAEFVDPATFDYRLKSTSPQVSTVAAPGSARGVSLAPLREYVHPATSVAITASAPFSPGAFQRTG